MSQIANPQFSLVRRVFATDTASADGCCGGPARATSRGGAMTCSEDAGTSRCCAPASDRQADPAPRQCGCGCHHPDA